MVILVKRVCCLVIVVCLVLLFCWVWVAVVFVYCCYCDLICFSCVYGYGGFDFYLLVIFVGIS